MEEFVELPLSKGRGSALIDAEDVERVLGHRWFLNESGGCRYARSKTGGYLHRLIMGLRPGDGLEVDHINGDGLDNRRTNLRVVTHAQNQQNRSRQANHTAKRTSHYRGVSWWVTRQCWSVRVKVDGTTHFGGYYLNEDEAGRAAAELRRHVMPYATS